MPRNRAAVKTDRSVHVSVWVAFTLLVLVLLGFSRLRDGSDIWAGWIPAKGLLQPDYAERILQRAVFRTPANTWSNLAYVLVGFYAIALAWRDRRGGPAASPINYLQSTPTLGFLFGAACCYLGLASGLYHASLTRLAQQLDVASMYAPLLASLALFAGRAVRAWRKRHGWPAFDVTPLLVLVVVAACWLLFVLKWSMSAKVVLQTLIGLHAVAALLEISLGRGAMPARWLGFSLVALVAAVACRELDVARKFSRPDAWFQGHACWHVLTAVSLACVYLYHRNERTERAER
jgi:predicted membrane channel-forming protein YqfA (hemolysin III family)